MNKKLYFLIIMLTISSSFISYKVTYSFFNDTSSSQSNTFTAAAIFPIPTTSPTASPTPSGSLLPTPTPIAQTLVMNELLPDSSCSSGNDEGQFLELWNGSGVTISLQNFQLSNGTETIAITNSNTNLDNNEFAILAKSNGVVQQCLDDIIVDGTTVVNLGGQINLDVGLLRLLDADDNVIDTIQWGTGQLLQPSQNQSIERLPLGHDSALGTSFNASDMVIKTTPTPGQ
jgi:hypothetical protein